MDETEANRTNSSAQPISTERLTKEALFLTKAASLKNSPIISDVDPSPENADTLLAKELYQLSMDERDKVFSDIHGVADIVKEEPTFLHFQLSQLETELSKIRNKTAYDLAESLSFDYVKDPKFRLLFLRATSFDVEAAAYRMARFFQEKLELFGADKLAKDIEWSDLDDDDIETIESGWFQVLPGKDRSGRLLIGNFPKLRRCRTPQNGVRHFVSHILRFFLQGNTTLTFFALLYCSFARNTS
jgi:hypothetical protein